tara:strand:- start:78 stop:386 length:309 start_codon:yes stop_codon:yes gene_type:complete
LKDKLGETIVNPSFLEDAKFILYVSAFKSLSERTNPDVDDMTVFLSFRSDRYGNACAIVAQQSLHFGPIRMGPAIAEFHGMNTMVFEYLDEAEVWFDSGQTI